jgi:membrane protein implicated in regulation of membrane protease activity
MLFEAWHIWVLCGLLLLVAELFTAGFLVGVFGISCLATAAMSAAQAPLWAQLAVFAVVTAVVFFTIRPAALRYLHGKGPAHRTNTEALVGKAGVLTEAIAGPGGLGRVKVGGDDWRALGADGVQLEVGTAVVVQGVDGTKLIVVAAKGQEVKA